MTQGKIDPITVATAIASTLFGPDLAHYIGPYAVILMGSTTGAAWALGRAEPMSNRFEALWFFMRLNMMALLLTVPLAIGTTWAFTLEDSNWLLVPIALFIGALGNDWPAVGRWILTRVGRLFERRTDTGE